MSQNKTIKLHALILLSTDLHKAVAFYQALGLPLLAYSSNKWAEFLIGSTRFALCPSEAVVPHHTGLVLEVEDIEVFAALLTTQEVAFTGPFEVSQGKVITVTDPSGNQFDFFQVIKQEPRIEEEEGCCGRKIVKEEVSDKCCKSKAKSCS